jgi:TolB-like protein/DNA-binding winged helix-turn-helix (wHTH) protein
MDAHDSPADRFHFGDFEVDVYLRQLRKSGQRIRLQEQPFQVLVVLLGRHGELVTRDELRAEIWPKGTFVDFDRGLNTAIKKIRAALGDSANVPRYVETIPRRGYRFVAPAERARSEHCNDSSLPLTSLPAAAVKWTGEWRWSPLALLLAAALIAVSGTYAYFHWSRHHADVSQRAMLVVLPFENMSADSEQDYLCEGLSEELTTQLGLVDPKRLAVVARITASAYARNKTVAEIGRDLHADYVLEGSVRRDERRVRVAAQLIRVRDQGHVWANEFDREVDSLLAVQSEVASAIAHQVQSALIIG